MISNLIYIYIYSTIQKAEDSTAVRMIGFHANRLQNFLQFNKIPKLTAKMFGKWTMYIQRKKYYARRERIACKITQRKKLRDTIDWLQKYASIRKRVKEQTGKANSQWKQKLVCATFIRWRRYFLGIYKKIQAYEEKLKMKELRNMEAKANSKFLHYSMKSFIFDIYAPLLKLTTYIYVTHVRLYIIWINASLGHYNGVCIKKKKALLIMIFHTWSNYTHELAGDKKAYLFWRKRLFRKLYGVWKINAEASIARKHQMELDAEENQRAILNITVEANKERLEKERRQKEEEDQKLKAERDRIRAAKVYQNKMNEAREVAIKKSHKVKTAIIFEANRKLHRDELEKRRWKIFEDRWKEMELQMYEELRAEWEKWLLADTRDIMYQKLIDTCINDITLVGETSRQDDAHNKDGRLWSLHYDDAKQIRYYCNIETLEIINYDDFNKDNMTRANAHRIIVDNYTRRKKIESNWDDKMKFGRDTAVQIEVQTGAAKVIQNIWRRHKTKSVRKDYKFNLSIANKAKKQRHIHNAATLIQKHWRKKYHRRNMLNMLTTCYQKRLDPESGQVYFFSFITKRATWEKPSWLKNIVIPDPPTGWVCITKPEIRSAIYVNHYTKEELTEPPKGYRICQHCSIHFSTKLCSECSSSYCDICYDLIHYNGSEIINHAWSSLQIIELRCIDCHKKAVVECHQCNDFYCEPCCDKFHDKGNRSKHVRVAIGQKQRSDH